MLLLTLIALLLSLPFILDVDGTHSPPLPLSTLHFIMAGRPQGTHPHGRAGGAPESTLGHFAPDGFARPLPLLSRLLLQRHRLHSGQKGAHSIRACTRMGAPRGEQQYDRSQSDLEKMGVLRAFAESLHSRDPAVRFAALMGILHFAGSSYLKQLADALPTCTCSCAFSCTCTCSECQSHCQCRADFSAPCRLVLGGVGPAGPPRDGGPREPHTCERRQDEPRAGGLHAASVLVGYQQIPVHR